MTKLSPTTAPSAPLAFSLRYSMRPLFAVVSAAGHRMVKNALATCAMQSPAIDGPKQDPVGSPNLHPSQSLLRASYQACYTAIFWYLYIVGKVRCHGLWIITILSMYRVDDRDPKLIFELFTQRPPPSSFRFRPWIRRFCRSQNLLPMRCKERLI